MACGCNSQSVSVHVCASSRMHWYNCVGVALFFLFFLLLFSALLQRRRTTPMAVGNHYCCCPQEAKRQEAEEKEREKEKEKQEKQREKEAEEEPITLPHEAKRKRAEEEEERKRKQKELIEKEADAVKRARLAAHRPLNSFEERRVRRQVRSEVLGGGGLQVDDGHKDDWTQPLKPEIKAQLDDAVKFFSDTMRVPAALIGSAALGMLFLPPKKFGWCGDVEPQPEVFDFLYRAYVILTAATLCLELTAVLETSNAHVQLLELGRHGLALEPTAMDLIMANLEFEYLVCSLSFLGGVVCFMLATMCRVLVVFNYTRRSLPREPELCFVVATMMFLLLLVARFRSGEMGIMGYVALLVSFISLGAAGRLMKMEYRKFLGRAPAKEDDPA
ncbi:TBC1D13, partial [Symbiodinium pilosum]